MSARLKRNAHLLRTLSISTPRKRRDILLHSSTDFVNSICELALNVLKGNIPLSPSQYKTLKRRKKTIRLLADKKIGVKKKRKILSTQSGGILPLLAIAAPLIGELIAGFVRR